MLVGACQVSEKVRRVGQFWRDTHGRPASTRYLIASLEALRLSLLYLLVSPILSDLTYLVKSARLGRVLDSLANI
jgi:hypothetical protein